MKKIILIVISILASVNMAYSQKGIIVGEGKCGEDLKWSFDGYTLTITNVSKMSIPAAMDDYTLTSLPPWIKKKYDIRRLCIESGITKIGACAFANCTELLDVELTSAHLKTIGWGAFMNCSHLRTISLPSNLERVETIAFANCKSLSSITIPDKCRVGDQAFLSCTSLSSLSIGLTSIVGHLAFASEVVTDSGIRHSAYTGEIKKIPAYINESNCNTYGLSKTSVNKLVAGNVNTIDYDEITSDVDVNIPHGFKYRYNTYALIIGNQQYRFAPDVPYAIHDARVFSDYCVTTLGVPSENIHICENATKYMILDEEMSWLKSITDKESKRLIVYYAGHGVPDIADKNKAYMLPADVRGAKPKNGIALDSFYADLAKLDFHQVSVFLDACFSGITRDNESVNEGTRAVEIEAEDVIADSGNIVVFSAAQGNQMAQGYSEHGHGLFTYFLLKAIQESNGEVTLGNLSYNLTNNVSKTAPTLELRKSQTPTTNPSESAGDSWMEWNL